MVDLSQIPVRHSSRSKNCPSYLKDYVCNLSNQTGSTSVFASTSHWCNLISADKIPFSENTVVSEPKTYKEAASNSLWSAAMQKELDALEKNNTWELVPCA